MRTAYEMDPEELALLVDEIQRKLYLERRPDNGYHWNEEKFLECPELIEFLDHTFAVMGLHPTGLAFRERKHVHRPSVKRRH